MGNKNIIKRSLSRRFNVTDIVVIMVLGYILYVIIDKTFDNFYLNRNGIETNAIITDVRKVGSKGKIKCWYFFSVNDSAYSGSVYDDNYNVGDTIIVIYKSNDPKINRDKKFLE